MRENRSTFEILGSLVGLVVLIVILYAAVGYFRQGATEFNEVSRVAGRPVTLAESLSGEAITTTTETTGAATLTNTIAVTGTTGITGATDVTATNAITAIIGTTTTAPLEAAAITTTADLTATTPVTATTDITVTQTATVTTAVTATTTITEDTPLVETPNTTTTTVVTATNVVTTGNQLTETGELTTTTTSTDVEEAAPEVAAIFTKAACIGCHVIPGVPNAVGQVGPNLTTIGVTAATRIEGYSSEEYIRESLLQPNQFIAPQCPIGPCLPNLMVQNLGDILTPQELDTVVAYLTSLGTTD